MNVTPVDISDYYYTKTQVDASFALIVDLTAVEASINDVLPLSSYINTSEYYDGSINNIRAALEDYVDISTLFRSKTVITLSITDVSTTWNIDSGYNAKVTLTKDISLNVINLLSGDSGTLIVKQDGTGNRDIKLPIGSVRNGSWSFSTAANAIDIVSFLYDGSYYWNKGGPYT